MDAGMDEVARIAGVSTATVSRALRDLPNVSTSTRAKVLAAAREIGYVVSPTASRLASGRTSTIGLLTPWVNHWFFSNAIEGAERALRAEGFDALLHIFDSSRTHPRSRLEVSPLRRRVDGVIVLGLPLDADEVARLVDLGLPVVFVGTGAPGQVTVRLDDELVGATATRHLLGLGHRVVAHMTGTTGLDAGGPWAPGPARARGWQDAMRAEGLDPESGLLVDGGFTTAGARDAVDRLLVERPDVTAVFAGSDEMALGVILGARARGLRVPEDLSVIGVDGHELGELLGLTTLAQDVVEQGATAAALLLDMITGAPVLDDVVYPVALLERGSTAPPRTGL